MHLVKTDTPKGIRRFAFVLTPAGKPSHRNDVCRPESDEIEVWSVDLAGAPGCHETLGQFVTSYNVSTLTASGYREPPVGLELCGHEPAWKLDVQAAAELYAFARGVQAAQCAH